MLGRVQTAPYFIITKPVYSIHEWVWLCFCIILQGVWFYNSQYRFQMFLRPNYAVLFLIIIDPIVRCIPFFRIYILFLITFICKYLRFNSPENNEPFLHLLFQVLVEANGSTRTLILNRPKQLNALSSAMVCLQETFQKNSTSTGSYGNSSHNCFQ